MTFKEYIEKSWAEHEKQTDQVVLSYEQGISLIQSEDELLGLSRLVSHIASDHNFKFNAATVTLQKLFDHPLATAQKAKLALTRLLVTLKYMADQTEDISNFSLSDRTIIFASTAASLLLQKNFDKAKMLLNNAIAASHSLKENSDPAFKTLAMCTNNMAAALSEKNILTPQEESLMIETAQYARNFWEKAGTWLNVERAEYYLSKYFRKIVDLENAERHGYLCLEICEKEKADPVELFFAHQSLALVFRLKKNDIQYQTHLGFMRKYFTECGQADQSWMKASLTEAEG